jgi:photosystem II stability/assembly factor-like uncharacterized protein
MQRKRFSSVASSSTPFLIIGGLLYAGFCVKPEPKGDVVAKPAFERSDRLYGTAVEPGGTILLVGNDGKILASSDAARSWRYVTDPVSVSLQDVAAWDDKRAVAVGNDGVVIVTNDGGKSWKRVDAPRSKIANKLMHVKAAPDGRAVAVGEGGVIITSSDYGQHWASARPEEDIAWNDVYLNGAHGWIVGERGRILVSSDSGRSWREVKGPVKSSLMAVSFRNENDGVAVGLNGAIIATDDGGATWREEPFKSPDVSNRANGEQAKDGSTNPHDRGETEHLLCVTWDGTRWVAAGTKGVIAVGDADAEHWRGTRLSPDDRQWYTAIVPYRSTYLLSGSRFVSFPMKRLTAASPAENAGEHA